MSSKGIRCSWMRGGTSKGAYFVAEDLPADSSERDQLLMSVMGSPDPRQIDGIGGADPLTSKVAVVSASSRPGVDIDYLFLQVFVDQAIVTDAQNCGNILAGVGQFAIERGLVSVQGDETTLAVYMQNSDQVAEVTLQTPGRKVIYHGDTSIDGVPGQAAAVLQNFPDAAGSSCGALLPTNNVIDQIDGIDVTCIDNGMPTVVLPAAQFNIQCNESRSSLDNNETLKTQLERIRLQVGPLMNLGDVAEKSVPKMTLVAPAQSGGTIATRTFIPHRCHASIGVLGAVSVATACLIPGSVAAQVATLPEGARKTVSVEHPSGETSVLMQATYTKGVLDVKQAALVRTARKLFEGTVYPGNWC